MASTEPRRGEVWLTSLGAGRTGEPGKNRPAIVISADRLSVGSVADLIAVVPMSSSAAPSPVRPEVTDIEGVDRPSRAICRAIRGVAPLRLLRPLGVLAPQKLAEIERALALVLDLDARANA